MANQADVAGRRTVTLTADNGVTIETVRELKVRLLNGLAEFDRLVLDPGATGAIDIAGLQLLCAAHHFALARGRELLLTGSRDQVRELAHAAGFVRGTPCTPGGGEPCFWDKVAR